MDLERLSFDNFYELDILHDVLSERDKKQDVLLRITPGVEAHTHDYISTGQTIVNLPRRRKWSLIQHFKSNCDPYLNVLGVSL